MSSANIRFVRKTLVNNHATARRSAGRTKDVVESTDARRRPRICVLVTAPVSLKALYRGQFEFLQMHGLDITAVSAPGPELDALQDRGIRTHGVSMERVPSPIKDVASLCGLWRLFRRERFDLIHVSTPKAGLLGSIAATLAGNRAIVFTLRGRTYENSTGLRRMAFVWLDKLTCQLATRVIPISKSLADAVVTERICPPTKVRFLGSGSSNGIDASRFKPNKHSEMLAGDLKRQLGIAGSDRILLFVGRIRREKGVDEMLRACQPLLDRYTDLHLLLVGQYEPADPIDAASRSAIETHDRIHTCGWMDDPAAAYWASEFVVMPSHREGFGNVALEASAAGIPVVGFDVVGLRDAIEDQVSGILTPFGDVNRLRCAIELLLTDDDLRIALGRRGMRRVEACFRQEIIWEGLLDLYRDYVETPEMKHRGRVGFSSSLSPRCNVSRFQS